MKKFLSLTMLVLTGLLMHSCKKTTTITPPLTNICQLKKTSILNGSSVMEYNSDGYLINLKQYDRNSLASSTTIGESIMETKSTGSVFPITQTTVYEGSLRNNLLPSTCSYAITEGAITRTHVRNYYFFYDNKNRIERVVFETKHVVGDFEYELLIKYNDQDNVASLKYVWITGPNTSTTIVASEYDDKQSPYSNLRAWKFILSWDGDPTPIFAQLSKNNPGKIIGTDSYIRKMNYTYNDKGFPITKTTNTVNTAGEVLYTVTTYLEYNCN